MNAAVKGPSSRIHTLAPGVGYQFNNGGMVAVGSTTLPNRGRERCSKLFTAISRFLTNLAWIFASETGRLQRWTYARVDTRRFVPHPGQHTRSFARTRLKYTFGLIATCSWGRIVEQFVMAENCFIILDQFIEHPNQRTSSGPRLDLGL